MYTLHKQVVKCWKYISAENQTETFKTFIDKLSEI